MLHQFIKFDKYVFIWTYTMRLIEFLTEASNREKARRAKLSAQSKRAAANAPVIKPMKKKGVPSNVPDRSHYMTGKPLRAQQDVFSGPEFDEFRAAPDDHPERGVVIRFNTIPHEKTKNPIVYAYWSHSFAPDFKDAANLGNCKAIGLPYSELFIELVKHLIKTEGAVHILISPDIEAAYPKEIQSLEKWIIILQNSKTKDIKDKINNEFDHSELDQVKHQDVKPVAVPTASFRIPNAEVLQQKLVQRIRTIPELNTKYMAADNKLRTKALNAGVQSLHKFNDIDDAIYDVESMLE